MSKMGEELEKRLDENKYELLGALKEGYEFIRHLRALEPESDIEIRMSEAIAKVEGV